MLGRLNGKVALVTGASSGIGEATAVALAAEGARIAAAARRRDRLEALVKRIEEHGGQALPLVVDVADETQERDGPAHARYVGPHRYSGQRCRRGASGPD